MNRKALLAGLLIVTPLVLLLVMSLGRDPHKIRTPLVGRDAPPFQLRKAGTAEFLNSAMLSGKPLVLNFWASWCVPCYSEHPVLIQHARALRPDVQFIGIAYADEEKNVMKFLDEQGSEYPTLLDENGSVAIAFGVHGVPETFFINRSGKIVAKHDGPLTAADLASNVKKAVQ